MHGDTVHTVLLPAAYDPPVPGEFGELVLGLLRRALEADQRRLLLIKPGRGAGQAGRTLAGLF